MDEIDLRMYVQGIRYCIAGEECPDDKDCELGYSHQYAFEQMLTNKTEAA